MSAEYRVVWTFDVEADSPIDAARKAFDVMQREGTTANCFEVFDARSNFPFGEFDLMADEQPMNGD